MAEIVTTDTIIDWLKDAVEHKRIVDAHTWIDAAQKLTVLLGDEHDMLFNLEQKVAQQRVKLITDGFPVSKAKAFLEETDIYRATRTQKARISRIEEMIRVAKIQARLKDNEYRSQQ